MAVFHVPNQPVGFKQQALTLYEGLSKLFHALNEPRKASLSLKQPQCHVLKETSMLDCKESINNGKGSAHADLYPLPVNLIGVIFLHASLRKRHKNPQEPCPKLGTVFKLFHLLSTSIVLES